MAFDGLDEALLPSLLGQPLEMLADIMNTLQVCLLDLERLRKFAIDLHEQLVGEGSQVHFLSEVDLSEGLLIHDVERVGEVLESHEDLILVKREEAIRAVGPESNAQLLGEGKELLILFVLDSLLECSLVIESEEVLGWLLDVDLLLSLEGPALLGVEDLHEVLGLDADALAIAIGLVDACLGAVFVGHENAPVLHQLDCGWA